MLDDTDALPTPPTALLKAAHQRLRELLERYAAIGPEEERARRAAHREVREALEIHLDIEEALFYPALLKHWGEEAGEIVKLALADHRWLKESSALPPDQLQRVVLTHLEREEAELFPLAHNFPVETQKRLSHDMEARRTRLEWR